MHSQMYSQILVKHDMSTKQSDFGECNALDFFVQIGHDFIVMFHDQKEKWWMVYQPKTK